MKLGLIRCRLLIILIRLKNSFRDEVFLVKFSNTIRYIFSKGWVFCPFAQIESFFFWKKIWIIKLILMYLDSIDLNFFFLPFLFLAKDLE